MVAAKMAAELIIVIIIGIYMGKSGMVSDEFSGQLVKLLMNICLPSLIILSFCTEFSVDDLKHGGWIMILAVLTITLGYIVGSILMKIYRNSDFGKLTRYGTMFVNSSFIGIPVVEALYGQDFLFFYNFYTIPGRILFYGLSEPLLKPHNAKTSSRPIAAIIKGVMSPPMIALFIGLFLYFTGLRLPVIVTDVMTLFRNCCGTLGMLLCGLSLSKFPIKDAFRLKYLPFTLIRILVMPALVLGMCLLLGQGGVVLKAVIFHAACPCVSLSVAYTIMFHPDDYELQQQAGSLVFMSTLMSAISIPFWSLIVDFF